jgi:hypothetical protein
MVGQRAVTPWLRQVGSIPTSFTKFHAPFVYRLGHPPFTQKRGVRLPYGVP